MEGGAAVFNVSSWRWPQWVLFGLGLFALASYFGLISLGRVEFGLERLAGNPEATAVLFEKDTGRAEALFIVLGFLLLTPVVVIVVASVPMFLSALAATYLNRATGMPIGLTTLVVWLIFVAVAGIKANEWWPWAQWVGQLVARAFLIAMG